MACRGLVNIAAMSRATTSRAGRRLARRLPAGRREGRARCWPATRPPRERQVGTGRGAGGDESLVFDRGGRGRDLRRAGGAARRGAEFTAISEERGEVTYGDGSSPVRVVVDPIDGSLNAKRLIPSYCVSIAVSAGDTMEDVEFAFVHDFGTRRGVRRPPHGARS